MRKLLIVTCLAVCAASVQAAPVKASSGAFNYRFIEAQYVDMDVDSGWNNQGPDLDGIRFKGSFTIAPSFSLIGSLLDTSGDRVDLTVLTVGAAYHQALPKLDAMPLDLVLRAEIEKVEFEAGRFDDSETGVLLGAGLQMEIVDRLYAFGDVNISSNDYRDMSLLLGGRYAFVPQLEGTASIEVGDLDVLAVGLRYNF